MDKVKWKSGAIILLIMISSVVKAQVYLPDTNMISNGDFMSRDPQQRPLRWISGTGLQTATISGQERHGTRTDDQSLKVADTSTVSNVLVRSEKKIANPGTNYIATAWVKTKTGQAANFAIEFWDQNNSCIASKLASVEPATGWQQVRIDLRAPDKCTHVTVAVSTSVPGTGVSYWDDVLLFIETNYNPNLKHGVREIFADDYRIEKMNDVRRIANAGIKSKPIIKADKPWEGNDAYIYGTVLRNEPAGTGYRMWYTSYSNGYHLCYATSKDGINWTKPDLGLIDHNGSKHNNICIAGGGTLVYDQDDADASKRYKLMTFDGSKEKFGYGVHFSPDGLHWTAYAGNPVISYGDVSNVAYDREKKLFIATTKQRMLVSNTSVTPGKLDRAAFVSVSKDFIHWSAPGAPNSPFTIAVEGDDTDDMRVRSQGGIEANIYGMPVYPYEGAYVGFPWVFDISNYTEGEFAVTGDGNIQPQIAFSRDLRLWTRLARQPVIPVGQAGAWDDGTVYTATTLLVDDREMTVYYGGMDLPHGGGRYGEKQYACIAKATWRRDGLISLYNGGDDPGTITTKLITFTGKQLKINTKLNYGGSLKVEILDNSGNAIEGYRISQAKPIKNDQFAVTAEWDAGSDLSKLEGKNIKLRFHLTGGNLYSYWFE
jgi:hypothetical protein